MKLGTAINKIWSKFVPYDKRLQDGARTLVMRKFRADAKARYLAYRCREYIRNYLNETDSNNTDITKGEFGALEDLASDEVRNNFQRIEEIYLSALNRNTEERIDLNVIKDALKPGTETRRLYSSQKLKIREPDNNRSHIVWDIVWGLVANDHRWIEHQIDLFEQVERRLRKVERMRYNVSMVAFRKWSNDRTEDGHVLRMFEYPKHIGASRSVGGQGGQYGAEHWTDLGFLYDSGTGGNDGNVRGRAKPVTAIKAIFETPSTPGDVGWRYYRGRTFNYCDNVIHTLHLEEVARHLIRTEGGEEQANEILKTLINDATDNLIKRQHVVSIKSSWASETLQFLVIGTGLGADMSVGRSYEDPFFELVEELRLDQLVPGDQIILRTHPAFYGVTSGKQSVWALENFLVARLLGRRIPRDIEIQGHGTAPWKFLTAQRKGMNTSVGFGGAVRNAQKMVLKKRKWQDESSTNPQRSILEKGIRMHDLPPYAPLIFDDIDEPLFDGVIEFRNEFRHLGGGLGALWARWRIHWDETEFYDWYKGGGYDSDTEWSEYHRDNLTVAAVGAPKRFGEIWKMPFISSILIDVSNSELLIKGHLLSEEKVVGVYLVTHTRRSLTLFARNTPTRGFEPHDDESMLSILGEWQVDGENRSLFETGNGMTFTAEGIHVHLPPEFNPPSNYWRPVLKTRIMAEVRAQVAFRWPSDAEPAVIGHGAFNICYFPLFEKVGSRYRPVKVPFSEMAARRLLSFYNLGSPSKTIRSIGPRNPVW